MNDLTTADPPLGSCEMSIRPHTDISENSISEGQGPLQWSSYFLSPHSSVDGHWPLLHTPSVKQRCTVNLSLHTHCLHVPCFRMHCLHAHFFHTECMFQ